MLHFCGFTFLILGPIQALRLWEKVVHVFDIYAKTIRADVFAITKTTHKGKHSKIAFNDHQI